MMNIIFFLDNEILYCLILVLNVFFKQQKNIHHTFTAECAFIIYLTPHKCNGKHGCTTCNLGLNRYLEHQ